MKKLQNFVKTLIVSAFLNLLLFSSSSLAQSEEIIKQEYTNATCFESASYADCTFKDGRLITGGRNSEGNWDGNIRIIDTDYSGYLFFRGNTVNYGKLDLFDGYYVGYLDAIGNIYGLGSYYYDNGTKRSYQNWHEENKIGYQISNGVKSVGIFDKNHNLILKRELESDFQLKLNTIELKAQSIEIDFRKEFNQFQIKKNNFLNQSEKNENVDLTNINNKTNSSSNQSNISTSNTNIQNNKLTKSKAFLFLGVFVFLTFIIIWATSKKKIDHNKQSVINRATDEEENKSAKKFKNFSLSDSRKLYSLGVKEYMTTSEACKQLRVEYGRWKTLSNSSDLLKKSLSHKKLNQIIMFRGKLDC